MADVVDELADALGDVGVLVTAMTGQEDEDPTAPGHERRGVPLRRPGDAREAPR